MTSHGKPANLARWVMSATLPFDIGEMMYFFFNRLSPSTESGQGLSRRQTWAQLTFSSSLSPSILYCLSRSSRIMRCKSSSLVHGISPLRTLSIAGLYPRRQRSVNPVQSIFKALALPQLVASANHGTAPVNDGAEYIEDACLHLTNSGFTSSLSPAVREH